MYIYIVWGTTLVIDGLYTYDCTLKAIDCEKGCQVNFSHCYNGEAENLLTVTYVG